MKLLLLFFLITPSCLQAQKNDFFLLKKKNDLTIKSFYEGSYISLVMSDNEHYSGIIRKVMKDSVWIEYQQVVTGMTAIGSIITDTIAYEAKRFAVKDIRYIKKEKRGFNEAVPSAILKIGGAGYIFLHTFNGIIQKDKISIKNISIAAGAFVAGVLMNKLKKEYYYIGKRYSVQYVSLPPPVSQ